MPDRGVLLLVVLAALGLPSAAVPAANPVLAATVGTGDAFVISLKDASGNPVSHLNPGTYTIVVHDLSEIHNFHLLGPGVDMATPVADTSEETWTVTFVDGRYRYQCDPHSTVMHGRFTVGTPPPPTQLVGSVGPRRTIGLRFADGSKVSVLTGDGAVQLVVVDRSRTDNFHLSGTEVDRKTGVGFRGRVTWDLTLLPGKYSYRSDKHKSLRGFFTVSSSAYPA